MSKTTNYLRNYIRKVTSQNGEEGVIEFLLNKIYDNELSSQDNLQAVRYWKWRWLFSK